MCEKTKPFGEKLYKRCGHFSQKTKYISCLVLFSYLPRTRHSKGQSLLILRMFFFNVVAIIFDGPLNNFVASKMVDSLNSFRWTVGFLEFVKCFWLWGALYFVDLQSFVARIMPTVVEVYIKINFRVIVK